MTVDLEHLKALALAATPGPWTYSPMTETEDPEIGAANGSRVAALVCADMTKQNSAFIAAANPAVVLELVARIRALEAELDEDHDDDLDDISPRATPVIRYRIGAPAIQPQVDLIRHPLPPRLEPMPDDPLKDILPLNQLLDNVNSKVAKAFCIPSALPLNLPASLDLQKASAASVNAAGERILDVQASAAVGAAFYNFSNAERFDDARLGVVFTVENPVECSDFSHLIGTDVIINREVWRVKRVERFAHCAPWRKGERIGLQVEPAPASVVST